MRRHLFALLLLLTASSGLGKDCIIVENLLHGDGALAVSLSTTIRLPIRRNATMRSTAPAIGVSPTFSTPNASKMNPS